MLPSTAQIVSISASMVAAVWDEYFNITVDSSVFYMLLTCMLKVPIDLRHTVMDNVVLVGGGATVPGYGE